MKGAVYTEVGFSIGETREYDINSLLRRVKSYLPALMAILSLFFCVPAESGEINEAMHSLLLQDSIKNALPSNARWSFSAVDVETGRTLVDAGNAQDSPLEPASLVKLFLTAAILDLNSKENSGPITLLTHDGTVSSGKLTGNLYIKGSGNAFLSESDLRKTVVEILSSNIHEITGDIVIDDLIFDTKGINHGYHGPAYSAPAALGLDMHTVSITASGNPISIKVSPVNDAVKIIFLPGQKPSIRQVDDLTYAFTGNISGTEIVRGRFPLKDPAMFAGLTLKTLLKENKITFKGQVRRGEMPTDTTAIYKIRSKSLQDMVREINTNSLNVAADNLFLLLGAERFGAPGTLDKGARAVKMFLEELGMSVTGLSIVDGSGLSLDNRTTTGQMVEFLGKVSSKPWFGAFYKSLPRVGLDGTLKDTGYKHERIRAKTGQLRDAYCLAGYVESQKKSKIAFAYIVNVPGADLLWGRGETIFTLLERITDETI